MLLECQTRRYLKCQFHTRNECICLSHSHYPSSRKYISYPSESTERTYVTTIVGCLRVCPPRCQPFYLRLKTSKRAGSAWNQRDIPKINGESIFVDCYRADNIKCIPRDISLSAMFKNNIQRVTSIVNAMCLRLVICTLKSCFSFYLTNMCGANAFVAFDYA